LDREEERNCDASDQKLMRGVKGSANRGGAEYRASAKKGKKINTLWVV